MAKQPRPLAGRVVAITGAARGIGRATATALAREGMTVAIGDIDADLARTTAEEIGCGASAFAVDVTDRESFERFVDEVEARIGPVDVLVNNAGIMALGSFLAEDDATARRMVDINVHGVVIGMKVVLPRLVRRGSGHVVNIASAAGKVGFAGGASYSGTKHFVVGVSEGVRVELRGTGVDLSVVMPGIADTELGSGVASSRGVRKVTPEEIAAAIVEVLRRPRFDVYVPRTIGPLNRVGAVLPRGAREAMSRLLGIDRVLMDVDADARRRYEQRAARSGAGDAAPELTDTRRGR
jgi:NADP-dependent 3-hydroxy acid dehydrogenase YdfG